MPTPTKTPVQMFYSATLAHLQLHAANIYLKTPVCFQLGETAKYNLNHMALPPFLGLPASSRVTREIDK